MNIQKLLVAATVLCFFYSSCKLMPKKEDKAISASSTYPDFIKQSNIYEVNVRQYTKEGTFKAFEKSLPRLKDMGVEILWFMPITPISKVDRKGELGSYYAVADYTAVNPEFGTMEDWKALVNKAHELGFKVIIDWVANHTGADNVWLEAHPDFFVKDSTGKPTFPFDWSDVRQLNYKNPQLVDSMIGAMKFWLIESNIDGFRCDQAALVSEEFWTKCIKELRQQKEILMLAESEAPWVHKAGFNISYPWKAFHMMEKIAAGKRNALALDSVQKDFDTLFTKDDFLMYFTSNHDENSHNRADYGTFPGAIHAPFAVYTQTMKQSVPLIYSGQEEPFLDSISFFYKDSITFGKYQRAPFYKTLLTLRKSTPALAVDAVFTKLHSSDDASVYAYTKEKEGKKVLVILNFSNRPQSVTLNGNIAGEPQNVFAGKAEKITEGQNFSLAPWGYLVYSY